jgi:YD repeat-containing protein
MKKLSKTYKELGIDFTFPIEIINENGNLTYYEDSSGFWYRREYDDNGQLTYYENSNGFWCRSECNEQGEETYHEDSSGYWRRYEYDENGNVTYCESSYGYKEGTKRGSCTGKVIEVDGKKYKLIEL